MSDQQPPQYPGQGPQGESYPPQGGSSYPPQGGGYGGQYPPQGGYPQPGFTPPPPKHPQATTVLVLGIIGVVGTLMCCVPGIVAPFAWSMGSKAQKELEQDPNRYSGSGEINTGKILGIVGSVLLILTLLLVVVYFVFIVAILGLAAGSSSSYDFVGGLW